MSRAFAGVSLLTVFTAFAATQCSPPRDEPLPRPTGPHATGRTSFAWRDAQRDELETKADGDQRELMVHVFHPIAADTRGERAPYMPDGDVMRGVYPDAHAAKVATLRTWSLADAPLPAGDAKFPVLICAPGGGMKGLTYHVLCEDLASHGYVVAAIDPPYNARRVRFPDGRVLGDLPRGDRGFSGDERNAYRERIVHWANDIRFVIDQLHALNAQPAGDGPFAQRLDVARGVGVFGHSRGGQAAGTARLLDERVRGGVNLDGVAGDQVFQQLTADADDSGQAPFLWIMKSLPAPPTDEQLQRAKRTRAEYHAEIARVLGAWERRLGAVTGGALRVTIGRPDVTHIDFSDEPYWDELDESVRSQKQRTIAETRAWLRAFFAGTLRGEWRDLQSLAAGDADAGVTVQVFGKPWP